MLLDILGNVAVKFKNVDMGQAFFLQRNPPKLLAAKFLFLKGRKFFYYSSFRKCRVYFVSRK